MKKLMIPAVAIAMMMASCGDVKSDAKKHCDLVKESMDAIKSGDATKIADAAKKLADNTHKYEGADLKEYTELTAACDLEAAKSAVKSVSGGMAK